MKPAIIVIDMLKDFVWGSLKCDRVQRIVGPLRRLLHAARDAGIPIVFATDARVSQVGLLSATRRAPQAAKAADGLVGQLAARVVDELRPVEGDYHVPKHHYGAFGGTGLRSLLEDLGVDGVVLCGLHTNQCVASTAAEAFHHGYRIVVPTDGIEAPTEEEHEAGLDRLRRSYGAELVSVDELVERLASMALSSKRTVARSLTEASGGPRGEEPVPRKPARRL